MATKEEKELVAHKINNLRDKILYSCDTMNLFLSLMGGEELSWISRIPETEDLAIQKHIWGAYFLIKDYMKNALYDISDAYLRNLILSLAKQMAEDAENGRGYTLSSRSLSSSSVSVSFATSEKGCGISEVESLLKSLDHFRVKTMSYEDRSYLR